MVICNFADKVILIFLCFAFKGKMMLSRAHTRELQLLVGGLGIDPGNVKLELVVKNSAQFSQVTSCCLKRLLTRDLIQIFIVQCSIPHLFNSFYETVNISKVIN